jgi:hypothetical protein
MNTSLVNTISIKNSSGYKVINTVEKERWNYYIKQSYSYDFYHTCDYHTMETSGDPFLFVYEQEKMFIAIPLIKRKIDASFYFDCTSVYGYTGPLSNIDFLHISAAVWDDFNTVFENFLLTEKIVSVFTILHPLFNQHDFLKKKHCLHNVGKTVALDLKQSVEEQRAQYRRPIRMKINQLRRNGFEIRMANTREQLDEFALIYRENMMKVGASDRYLFDNKYFENFMNAEDFKTDLLLAYYNNRMVAGAMVVSTGNIMQLHLAGTCNEFLKESPMKLIFDEASLLARSKDLHFLHLGSGIAGNEDSLFHFKRGFSDCLFDFVTVRYIVDETIYNKLVNDKLGNDEKPNINLFPLYRFI